MHGMILDDAAGMKPKITCALENRQGLRRTAESTATSPTVGTQHDRQHTDLAGTAAKRPAAPLVRDEEASARRVPDGAVAREAQRPFADNTAGTPA